MTKGQIITLGTFAVVILLALMFLLVQVGGPQIRTAGNLYQIGQLTPGSGYLSRGVPITIGVSLGQIQNVGNSTLVLLRSGNEVVTVGNIASTQVTTGSFKISLPCDNSVPTDTESVRLVLVDEFSGVLAQSEVLAIAEAGPDCIYAQ